MTLNLSTLSPLERKVFLEIVRRLAVDSGVAKTLGLEGGEEFLLEKIKTGEIKVCYDRQEQAIFFEIGKGV